MKKLFDDQGRLFGRISVIDICVVALALLLALAVFLRYREAAEIAAQEKAEVKTANLTYTVKVTGIRNYAVDALSVGDTVYDNSSSANLGTIENIEVTPSMQEVYSGDGGFTVAEVEDRYDVVLTLTLAADEKNGRYYAGNTVLMANNALSFHTKYANTSGQIVSITRLG